MPSYLFYVEEDANIYLSVSYGHKVVPYHSNHKTEISAFACIYALDLIQVLLIPIID